MSLSKEITNAYCLTTNLLKSKNLRFCDDKIQNVNII
jgi:hypothetical protein